MKEKFLALVSQIEDIRKTAHEEHVEGFFESDFVIYDVPEFISWKQKVLLELQQIEVLFFRLQQERKGRVFMFEPYQYVQFEPSQGKIKKLKSYLNILCISEIVF